MSAPLIFILVLAGLVAFDLLAIRFGVDTRQDEYSCRDASGRWLSCPRAPL